MKYTKIIKFTTESYEEEQFLLNRFPDAWWEQDSSGNVVFYIPESEEKLAKEVLNEYEERKK